ncbi:Erythromycin esterase type II [Actinoplanes sp. SE50]|uniref:erythromycin esterase family protein n=1 Tax=unclassified Actinoplanes TaxID=2626549 RepID=UPI00023EC49A|nr:MULTISPECIES: erythromycin esterase family protein [unclassified Actinoplanes]AEV85262.1 Erythromycin esterase type II [Actinoplanes sp. SE50/110]ATO83657.1 Erythromycin esterase type II [Actinoplanes sp. SE50]SLM01065.1 Erythromycin esterase type II [Actinoplanes sp. SE50/110]
MLLSTLDPDAGLDDLEPLRELVGGARVVGIGESAHNVREYQQVRHRLVRFLVERMGFTDVALESGFSEGLAVGRWIAGAHSTAHDDHDAASDVHPDVAVEDRAGAADDVTDRGLTYGFGGTAETRRLIRWLREHHRTGRNVRFAGLDLPAQLGSLLPAIDGVARYLAEADPAAAQLVDRIRTYGKAWASPHTLVAFRAYQAVPPADRDALTILLSELATRMEAMRPLYARRGAGDGFATARHELRLAGLLDQMLRAQVAAVGGSGVHAAVNVRDAAMAATARHLLAGGGRLVISAANTHLQRIPISLGGTFEVPVAGGHLAGDLGDDYLSIAVTCGGGRTPTRRPAPGTESGVEVLTVDLAEPVPGSLEALLPHDGVRITDLRPLRGTPEAPRRFRNLDGYIELPAADAFDFAVLVPAIGENPVIS